MFEEMGTLQMLARRLDADERTLRRAVQSGTVRAERPSPRRLSLSTEEREYLLGHWDLISQLRRALRTEPSVRLAVLYGSMARGDDRADSDVDLLASLDSDDPLAALALTSRLEGVVGRKVGVARLESVHEDAPLLLAEAIREGRVLLDRDGLWAGVAAEAERLRRRGRHQLATRRQRVRAGISEFLGET